MKYLLKLVIALVFLAGGCKTSSRGVEQSGNDGMQSGDGITEKFWKLVELNGNPVALDESVSNTPHIILKKENNRVNGHGGCNTITGSYEIDFSAHRIKFSQMVATMIACLNMEVEAGLTRALEMADNYSISADGKYLSLNRARMAPLARFEVEYLR